VAESEENMGNMSYCRFENTTRDLLDCQGALEEDAELSESENRARIRLISLCKQIADEYYEE